MRYLTKFLLFMMIFLLCGNAYAIGPFGGMWKKDSTRTSIQPRNDLPVMFPRVTIANLPTGIPAGAMVEVTDGDAADDCTTGSGSTRVLCRYSGSAWEAVGDGGGGSTVEDDVFGSGWNADTANAPSQNAVYDILHTYDTDDDGDIDNIDGAVGGGDITGVGPGGTGAGDALTDTYLTSGTTMFVWEGTTSDANQLNFVVPEADPSAATTVTYPDQTGTFIIGEGDGYADNTILTADGTGTHLTQETAVTIDDSNNMAGIGTIGSGAITSSGAVGGTDLTASDDIIGQDDLQLDSDGALIQLGEDQDIVIQHVADTGITILEGTEEILILEDGGAGSAVNELTILSAATTASPTIQQTGEADIGIDFETVNDEELLQLDAIAAGTNNLVIGNNANGSSPTIVAVGSSDSNVGISIDAKAAGEIAIGSADAKFSVASDALDISNTGAISGAGTISSGAITSSGSITGSGVFDVTGANPITIGSADVTAITLTTADAGDGSDVVLPAGSIQTGEILDGTIAENDLSATLVFDDGDLLNLGGITMSGTNDEGLVLPAWADTTPDTDQPYLTYDSAANALKVFEGGWVSIGATAAPTDADYLTLSLDGTLSAERVLTESTQGIDFTDSGANGTLTVSIDGTEVDAITWSDGANASNTWTFDVSGTDTTMVAGNGTMTFSGQVLATGMDIGTSQAIVGTTAMTVGDNAQTIAINSSDWDIGATGIGTGFGNFTSDGIIEGATLTEGGQAIYNAGETPGGELGGTWSSPTIDDSVTVATWTFTGTTIAAGIDGSGTISANLFAPDAADGADIGSTTLEFSDFYVADGSIIYFGNDQDVTLTHVADTGLDLNLALGIADDQPVIWGANDDWQVEYDESVDNQFLIHTTGTSATATGDPMFEILTDFGNANGTSMTADQEVFGVSKGTQASNVSLLALDEDGDLTLAGALTFLGGTDSFITMSNNASYAGSGYQLFFEGGNLTSVENGSEKIVLVQEDGATLTGTTWSFAGVTDMVLPTAAADASGELSMSTGNQLKWHDGTKVVTIDTTPTTDNYVLKYDNASATFTLEADETGGTPAWNSVTDPTADVDMAHDAGEETAFTYTGNYSTGSQFLVEQLTGNPTGGILFEAKGADSDSTVAQIGDGTNVWTFSTAGLLTNAGTATLNFAAASDLTVGGGQIDADDLASVTALGGSDTTLITGTTGTDTYVAVWNADGDLVDGAGVPYVVGGTDVADEDVANNITIDLATLATTVTVSDDESTADAHEVVFTTDNSNLESDGTFNYNPSTGTVTTTEFVGGGVGLTGLDGENIANDTIDNDSIDWADMTDLTTDGALDADVVDEAHIADDGIDSEHYNDGSIDTAHIAADQITSALIADDQVDSEHYVAASIDNEHMAANSIDSDEYVDGSIDIAHMSTDSVDYDNTTGSIKSLTPVTDATTDFAANFTGANLYGGTFVCDTDDGDLQLPAVAAGMNFTIITLGAIQIVVEPNASDSMLLDGVQLDDADSATNLSTAGDIIVFQYYSAAGWVATSNGWTDED